MLRKILKGIEVIRKRIVERFVVIVVVVVVVVVVI